jgi:O-antigen/teichoic acid export membrane protein
VERSWLASVKKSVFSAHLDTPRALHLNFTMSAIKHKAFSAVIWSALERVSGQLIRFTIGVVLARLLLPAEFGLIGMIAVFMGVSQVFINCGFGEALIQKQDATHQDESSVFYVNLALGMLAAMTLYCGAPWIARFYHQPILVGLTRFMALDLVIGSFGVVQTMLLTKKLDFKTQIKISVASTLVSGTLAIIMALKGFGVMSLVAQVLVGDFFSTLLLWILQGWRPLLSFSWSSLREMFPYGSRLFASGLLNSFFNEIYSIVIGKLFDPTMLGFYTRARQMQRLPVDNLSGIVGRVSFPVFAAIQHDKPALKRGVRKASKGLAWLNIPLMVGLAVTARPLVIVLLTEKWLPCVPYIQLLCVAGAFYPLSLIHVNALSAQGRSDLFLRLEIIKKVLTVIAVFATFQFGVTGLLAGGVVVGLLSYILNGYYSTTLFAYSWKEQFIDVLPYMALSALMGGCVWLAGWLPLAGNLGLLLIQVATGIAVYALGCWFWRVSSFIETVELVKGKLARFKSLPTAPDSSRS